MRIPVLSTTAPELEAYPAAVQQVLVQRAVSLLHAERKLAVWAQIILPLGCAIFGVLVVFAVKGGFGPSKSVPDLVRLTLESNFLGGAIGIVVGTFLWLLVRKRWLRPYLRRVIQEYERKDENRL